MEVTSCLSISRSRSVFVIPSSNIRPRHKRPHPGSSSRNLSMSICLSCLPSSVLSLWCVEQNKSVQRDERRPPLFFWTGSYVAQLPLNSLIVKDDFEILIPVSSSRIVRHHSLFTQ